MDIFNVETVDQQILNEESRIVKMCLIKYKCILIISFIIICLGQFIYILVNSVFEAQEIKDFLRIIIQKENDLQNMSKNSLQI